MIRAILLAFSIYTIHARNKFRLPCTKDADCTKFGNKKFGNGFFNNIFGNVLQKAGQQVTCDLDAKRCTIFCDIDDVCAPRGDVCDVEKKQCVAPQKPDAHLRRLLQDTPAPTRKGSDVTPQPSDGSNATPEPTERVTPAPVDSNATPAPTRKVTPQPSDPDVTPKPTQKVTPAPSDPDITPKPTQKVTPRPTDQVTPRPTEKVTPAPSDPDITPKPTQKVTPAPTPDVTPKPTEKVTPAPSDPDVTPKPTQKVTPRPTEKLTPVPTRDDSTPKPTEKVTPAPSNPDVTPKPTEKVTPRPTEKVTPVPTKDGDTPRPTEKVTPRPTDKVTPRPTEKVTPVPTTKHTPAPTRDGDTPVPTRDDSTPKPTEKVTPRPTDSDVTPKPTEKVTPRPTDRVTPAPTDKVTPAPTRGGDTPDPTRDNATPKPTESTTPATTRETPCSLDRARDFAIFESEGEDATCVSYYDEDATKASGRCPTDPSKRGKPDRTCALIVKADVDVCSLRGFKIGRLQCAFRRAINILVDETQGSTGAVCEPGQIYYYETSVTDIAQRRLQDTSDDVTDTTATDCEDCEDTNPSQNVQVAISFRCETCEQLSARLKRVLDDGNDLTLKARLKELAKTKSLDEDVLCNRGIDIDVNAISLTVLDEDDREWFSVEFEAGSGVAQRGYAVGIVIMFALVTFFN